MPRVPIRFALADIKEEVGQDLPALMSMDDLRVELNPIEPASIIGDRPL